MKKIAFLVWWATLSGIIEGQTTAPKPITLDDCFSFYKFYPQSVAEITYRADGERFVKADKNGLVITPVANPSEDSLARMDLPLAAQGFDEFAFNADESAVMLRANTEQVYRHSTLADYYVYDFRTGRCEAIDAGARIQFAEFSPDGRQALFVSGNNIHVKDLQTGDILPLSDDGAPNQIINGVPDWVYEEEFSPVDGASMTAARWSPDSRYVAWLRFDEREVPEYVMQYYEQDVYPRMYRFKYPKVGQKNSKVNAWVYDLKENRKIALRTPAGDGYLPRLYWTPDNRLVIGRLNRGQDTLDWLIANLAAGDTRLLLRETDPAYVDIESEKKITFLSDGAHFIYASESSGYNHLYLYGMDGQLKRPLTSGAWDLTAFYGLDEKNGVFYYQSAQPTPRDREVWEGYLDGRPPRRLSVKQGYNEAEFSPTFAYYTLTWSDINTPPIYSLHRRNGELVRVLLDNERARKMRQQHGFAPFEFMRVPAANGDTLNAWMLRPPNFDPAKRYPVLFDVYGGPGSQTVKNQYDGYLGPWRQLLAQNGVIVVSVDNRGTGGRGRDFKKCTQLQLGRYETEDQISAARYLATLPYIDPKRIGIWGWSFGGYLSTSCLLKGAETFRMAMAVAPTTNWKWYDSAYTERYMRNTADNERGYEDNSPVNFADRLRGAYLIAHGHADDNVHWQHSNEMILALARANKQFTALTYPNRNHGIYGENATRHLFSQLTAFVLKNL
ncbi:MAG: S9 family peptidase [Saprospiraceae bacterium]